MADLTASELRTLSGRLVAEGDLEAASAALLRAVEIAAADLAEAHGMLGGVNKRAGDLVAAICAYDAGFDVEARYNLASHYNALNRLVTRILLEPGCLARSGLPEPPGAAPRVDVPAELAKVRTRLADQAAQGEKADSWALGDLAVSSALTGHRRDMAGAVGRFEALSPSNSQRTRYQETAAALAALDTPQRELLSELASAFHSQPGPA